MSSWTRVLQNGMVMRPLELVSNGSGLRKLTQLQGRFTPLRRQYVARNEPYEKTEP